MQLNFSGLNPLEKEIYEKLTEYCKTCNNLRILDAAAVCGCSSSKISKCIKKIGFKNFKQFVSYAEGEPPEVSLSSTEFDRIRYYMDNFDSASIDTFIELLKSHRKILLFGLGPSSFCAQYMEYKLRLLLPDKLILSVSVIEDSRVLFDSNTLLVIFSTTGHFSSFEKTCQYMREAGGDTLLIIEEYHAELIEKYAADHLIFLSSTIQDSSLKAFQKSRVLTFIYIEEILFRLMHNHNSDN